VQGSDETAEGRRHKRVVVAWKARILCPSGSPVDAKVVDLSEGGLGLVCQQSVGQAIELEVWVAMPTDNQHAYQALRVRGRVAFQVYSHGECRIGLQFTQVDEASLDLLQRHVRAAKF
jgi:c-di-GMP-binding flagellar brake protein YcgR